MTDREPTVRQPDESDEAFLVRYLVEDILVPLGAVSAGYSLTGPELMLLLDDMKNHFLPLLNDPSRQHSKLIAEIDQQRKIGWLDFHPEEFCHRCGGKNVSSWSIDSDRWNMIEPLFEEHLRGGIICPGCFVELHEAATGMSCTWVLSPDPTTPFRHIEDRSEGQVAPE